MTDGPSRPVQPASFRSDRIDPAVLDVLVDALDAQSQNPGVQRLRSWSHEALAVRAGEQVLDVGAGTGSETQVLAAAAGPDGDAVGIEPNAGMRELAQQRAADAGSRAQFREGDAGAIPLPDESCDAVWCERVFQHLEHPQRAAAEMARVLRPGGRALVIDSDWATMLLHPGDPEVVAVLTADVQRRLANPFAGRRLAAQLSAAGLDVADIGSQALIHPPEAATGPLVQMMARRGVSGGLLDEAQSADLLATLAAAGRAGAFHMSVTMFAVLARKPER